MTDIWIDIDRINQAAKERLGYPTQKPIVLLKLLINACCPPDGIVLDPFCGSGTTLDAAIQLGRSAIGIDMNLDAVEMTKQRIGETINQRGDAE